MGCLCSPLLVLSSHALYRVAFAPAKGSIGDTVHLDGKTVGTISSLTRGTEDSVALVFLRKAAWDAEHVAVETAEGSVDARVHRD